MRGRRIADGSRAGIRPSRDRKERIDAFLQNESAATYGFESGTGYNPGIVDAYWRCEAGDPVDPWRQWQAHIIARRGIVDKAKYCYAAVKARTADRVSVLVACQQLRVVGNAAADWIDVVDLIGDVISEDGIRKNGGQERKSEPGHLLASGGVHSGPPSTLAGGEGRFGIVIAIC